MLVVVGLLVTMSACGTSDAGRASRPASTPMSRVRVSRTHTYGTLAALIRDADAVVVAHATGRATVEHVGAVPFTVSELDRVETLRGQDVGSLVEVRQPGSVDAPVEGGALLQGGRTYLLFLVIQRDRWGQRTGRYGIVGVQAGIYSDAGNGEFARTDESSGIPSRLTIGDVRHG